MSSTRLVNSLSCTPFLVVSTRELLIWPFVLAIILINHQLCQPFRGSLLGFRHGLELCHAMGLCSSSRADCLWYCHSVLGTRYQCGYLGQRKSPSCYSSLNGHSPIIGLPCCHHSREYLRNSWIRRGRILGSPAQTLRHCYLHDYRCCACLWRWSIRWSLQRVLGRPSLAQPWCFSTRFPWILR